MNFTNTNYGRPASSNKICSHMLKEFQQGFTFGNAETPFMSEAGQQVTLYRYMCIFNGSNLII